MSVLGVVPARHFYGTPTITPEKMAIIKDWYVLTIADANKATEVLDASVYTAVANTIEDLVGLLYSANPQAEVVVKTVTQVAKGRKIRRKLVIVGVGVGIYLYIDNKNKKKAQAKKEK